MPCLTSLAEMSHRGALPVCLSMMIGPKVTWLSRPLSSFRSTATRGCDHHRMWPGLSAVYALGTAPHSGGHCWCLGSTGLLRGRGRGEAPVCWTT